MSRRKKSNSEPYLVIPRRTIRSQELNSLSIQSRYVYIVLCTEWNRHEFDKPFIFTYSQLRGIMHISRNRIARCIRELEEAGFIEKTNHGGLERNPNTYTLNTEWLIIRNNVYYTDHKNDGNMEIIN